MNRRRFTEAFLMGAASFLLSLLLVNLLWDRYYFSFVSPEFRGAFLKGDIKPCYAYSPPARTHTYALLCAANALFSIAPRWLDDKRFPWIFSLGATLALFIAHFFVQDSNLWPLALVMFAVVIFLPVAFCGYASRLVREGVRRTGRSSTTDTPPRP
jgi:hypothetical protein